VNLIHVIFYFNINRIIWLIFSNELFFKNVILFLKYEAIIFYNEIKTLFDRYYLVFEIVLRLSLSILVERGKLW